MSGFGGGGRYGGGGGGGRYHNNNNNRGGGRGGRYRGGRSGGRGRGRGGGRGPPPGQPRAKLNPCREFSNGNCNRGNSCSYAHVLKLFGSINASSPAQQTNTSNFNNNYNNNFNNNYDNKNAMEPVSGVAIWETNGMIKIFTGSGDGYWRLWNTSGGNFNKEFEHYMGGSVNCVVVESNFLFCGFEAVTPALPSVPVGLIQAWNLSNPSNPPLEFYVSPNIPYAHNLAVSKLLVISGQNVVSGSKDGTIRLWKFEATANQGAGGFTFEKTLPGHAREITGLAFADNKLWSSSLDGAIRIWNVTTGECQHVIIGSAPNPQQPGQQVAGPGHSDAVTALVSLEGPSGKFVLSSSLDGDIKIWDAATGNGVACEGHGEGVATMSLGTDPNNNQVLLIGLTSGGIMVRNLLQTPKSAALALLLSLGSYNGIVHEGDVKAICAGPAATFYSGGVDGKVMVLQFVGDLGI